MAGLGKYFNATTMNGRANVAKATYASFALMYIVYRIRRQANKEVEPLEETETQPPENGPGCGCDACKRNALAAAKEPKLIIPEDPLLKPRKKQCDCDKHNSNSNSNSNSNGMQSVPVDEDEVDGCID